MWLDSIPQINSTGGTMVTNWTVILEEDGDDLVMPLPQELLDQMGWLPGDTLNWQNEDDGTWTITKST